MTSIKLIIKGAQHRLTVLHIHYYSQDSSKIFFLPSHIVYILCFVLFGHVPPLSLNPIVVHMHKRQQQYQLQSLPVGPLRIEPCMVPIAQCLLPTTLCPSLTAHYPLPIAWPGGMRGAIESAALAVRQELACRIHSRSPHPQITSCRSLTPSKSPPAPLRIPPGHPKTIRGLIL